MTDSFAQGRVFSGEIAATHPAKLFHAIIKQQKSGILTFDDGVTKARAFFKEGALVPYYSAIIKDKGLARYLVRNKKATQKELKRAKETSKSTGASYVQVLVDQGVVDRFEIEQTAAEFFWKTVSAIFAWRHGTFSFVDHDLEDYSGIINLPRTLETVLRGVIEHYNPQFINFRLKRRLKTPLRQFKGSAFSIDQFNLNEEQTKFARLLMNGTSIFEALGQVECPHSQAQALAFCLLTFETVKFKSQGKKKKAVSKKRTALDLAIEKASASVDRIHEQVALEKESAAPFSAAAQSSDPENSTRRELENKLKIMESLKEETTNLHKILERAGLAGDASSASRSVDEQISDANIDLGFLGGESLGDQDENSSAFDALGAVAELGSLDSEEESAEFSFSDSASGGEEGSEDVEFDLGELSDTGGQDDPFNEISAIMESPDELTFDEDESPTNIYKSGISYEENGVFDVAAKAFSVALDRGMDTAEIRSHLGWATYCADPHNEGFDQGATILQEAIKSDPRSHFPYLFLGKIYEAENDFNMAELYYIKALELNRDCEDAKNRIKLLYEGR